MVWRAWALLARGCLRKHLAHNPCEGEEKAQLGHCCRARCWEYAFKYWRRAYSPPQERKHEHPHVQRSDCRAQVGEATIASAASGGPSSVSICWIYPLVFSPRQRLYGVNWPLSPKPEVIKKRNRNGSSLPDSPRKSPPSITAICTARGIVTAKPRNSMARASGLPPPTRPLALSSSLGSPTEISMKRQRR